jgi:hypothetical protein
MLTGLKKILFIVKYILYLGVLFAIADVLFFRHILGYGYLREYDEENIQRLPVPYVMFSGRPHYIGHNELGFPGDSFSSAKPDSLKIAFFGGSTGYLGTPTIPEGIESELSRIIDADVFVANYSVVSSNHRQHLHGIIEHFSVYQPDVIVFYGGHNETVQSGYYDPRPGYPYNFFYRGETNPAVKLLIENSAIVGELDKRFGAISGIRRLRAEQRPFSEEWNDRIAEKYFETLELASNVAGSMTSRNCGHTRFLAFYQPYQVPEEFLQTHEQIKQRIGTLKFTFDVSSQYDSFGEEIFRDGIHVSQEARNLMGRKIAEIIVDELNTGVLSECRVPH